MRQYLKKRASHLLKAPKGNTGVPYAIFDDSNLMNNKDAFVLKDRFTSSQFNKKRGIYMIFNGKGAIYIGRRKNFLSRWIQHYSQAKTGNNKLYRTLSKEGFSSFHWLQVSENTDYLRDFRLKHRGVLDFNDHISRRILNNFTKYELCLLEQALIHAVAPSLNTDSTVHFTQNWNPSTKQASNRRPVIVKGLESGDIIPFPSMRSARTTLDIDRRLIYRTVNFNRSTYVPALNEFVTFKEPNIEIKKGSPFVLDIPLYAGVDFSAIPGAEIHILNKELAILDKFVTLKEARAKTGIRKAVIQHSMNKKFIPYDITSVLFVRNPDVRNAGSVPVIVIDILKNIAYSFSFARYAIIALHIPRTHNRSLVSSRLLNKDKKYKERFLFYRPDVYKGPLKPVKVKHGETIISGEEAKLLPIGNKKEVVLYNIKTNYAIQFPTIAAMLRHLGHNPDGTSIVTSRIKNGKTFKDKYQFYFSSDFKGTIHEKKEKL